MGRRSLLLAPVVLLLGACVTQEGAEVWGDHVEVAFAPYEMARDSRLVRDVGHVGARLLDARGIGSDRMRFRVLDTGGVQAYSLPNGAIFITLPLLLMLNSVEELAMVLGHEIGHVRARHGLAGAKRKQWVGAVSTISLLPLNVLSGGLANKVTITAATAPFSREEEREADDLGVELLHSAGFDVRCAIQIYRALRGGREGVQYGLFATHPSPAERFGRIAASVDGPGDNRSHATDLECDDGLLDSLDGLVLTDPPPPIVEADDGTLRLLNLSLQIPPDASSHAVYEFGWLYFRGQRVLLKRHDPQVTMQWAAQRVRELSADSDIVLLDELGTGGRPSLRVAWRTDDEGSREVQYREWIELGNRVYRISSEMNTERWPAAHAKLLELSGHLEPLDREAVPRALLQARIEIHEVGAGDTLESLAATYPDMDPEGIASMNRIEPGAALIPGRRLKVVNRIPLSTD